MPFIHNIKNLYQGVNAHLHSVLQSEDGWDSFHATHLTYLLADLKRQLRPLRYTADIEKSLQTMHFKSIIDGEEVSHYTAIGIYSASRTFQKQGNAVVWLELLSPSNKPNGTDFETYRTKREKFLKRDLVFVELDYLHEQPPTIDAVANYHALEPDSYPYRINVIDARPDAVKEDGQSLQFRVDESIPVVTLPLSDGDSLGFDFDESYQTTFTQQLFGSQVDYSHFPLSFDRYSPEDQTRITNRMLTIVQAHYQGDDLETVALKSSDIPLSDALSQLELLGIKHQ